MTTPKPPDGYGNKTTLTPTRTYQLPGGPYAAKLGKTEVTIRSEIKRGGDDDRGYGAER